LGRIDEALKRAAGGGVTTGQVAANQGHFVSAWEADQPVAASAPAAPLRTANAPAVSTETLEPRFESTPLVGLSALINTWGERLTCAPTCGPSVVEQFRRMAAVLHKAQTADGIRIVMVTSAAQSDGKTLTAINLALALSGSYKRRVLLIDADLRRPSIGKAWGLNGSGGLSEGLKAQGEQKLKVIPITPTLTLLPGGAPDPDPMSSLTSARMRRILEESVTQFDWVIVDAPPMGPVADANLLAEMVDTTVLVVRAAQTQYPFVQKAIETLGRERILGVVLNGVESSDGGKYGKYYDGSET
jgi:capsular exopolysaccharide synthesis family protein